jgi:hypothetical protein
MSTKSTETTFRSSRGRSAGASAVPQVGQNAAPAGVSDPQFGHAAMRAS